MSVDISTLRVRLREGLSSLLNTSEHNLRFPTNTSTNDLRYSRHKNPHNNNYLVVVKFWEVGYNCRDSANISFTGYYI
jgi:hypothetical protein